MKKITKLSAIFVLLTAFCMLSFTSSKAPIITKKKPPCGYSIGNALGCAVLVKIRIFSLPPASCSSVCNSTQVAVNIPAGGSYNILCNGCLSICNIEVTVLSMNGVACTNPPVGDFNTGLSPVTLCFTGTPCTIASGSTYLLYDSSINTFKIY